MLTADQIKLIVHIDETVKNALASNSSTETILLALSEKMPKIMELLKSASEEELNTYTQKYEGFYRYMKLLEGMAQGIADGDIKVPK